MNHSSTPAGKRILVIQGHPAQSSYCAALEDAYVQSAQAAGHEIRQLSLGRLRFDPILRKGYSGIQPLEPDLQEAQSSILWAQHLVFVYPIWWGAMPALLKGFIDRVFLPGFAFKYRKDSMLWDRLLKGRSAHLIAAMDTPPWYFRWVYGMPGHHQMKRTILNFSGVKPVTVTNFGPIRGSTLQQRESWLAQTRALAGPH